jgi:ribosomal protein L13E
MLAYQVDAPRRTKYASRAASLPKILIRKLVRSEHGEFSNKTNRICWLAAM